MSTKPANRQAALVARLRESGGDRVSFNLPPDVLSILDAITADTGATRTDALCALIRKAPSAFPGLKAALSKPAKI